MFISRREWEDKCDSNRALLKNNEEKEQIINQLKFQLENAEKHNIQLMDEIKRQESMNDFQKKRIEEINNDNDSLLTANQKLTDWVSKIINEVGIYEVHDRKSISIPIYKNPVRAYSGNLHDLQSTLPDFMNQEEILIPEIRFIKFKEGGVK